MFFIWKYRIETLLLVAFPNKNLMVLTLKCCIKFYPCDISGERIDFFFFFFLHSFSNKAGAKIFLA